jgi:hypothetical protein
VGDLTSLVSAQSLRGSSSAAAVGANYRGCAKWKETRAALAKRAPERGPKSTTMGKSPAPKARRAEPSEEQMELDEGLSHVVRGGARC